MLDVFRNKNERCCVVQLTRFRTCYICEFLKHIVRICFLREKFKKFVKKQLIKKKTQQKKRKTKKQKSRVYNRKQLFRKLNFEFRIE